YGDDRGEADHLSPSVGTKKFHVARLLDPGLSRFPPVISIENEKHNELYPFTGIFGSLRYHLGSGTRTGHSSRIKDFSLKGEVEMCPEDGTRLELKDGDRVRISSPYGAIYREVILRKEKDLRPGLIFIPMACNNNDAMKLIALTHLDAADSPGWVTSDVMVERMED
ncbi:MAG: molybdopterin dinucleotide binding domain-containing protein, partial [Thermodesulfobacteriota bacterium]|nr:molybdopterin dinucleotide binding domain-containing protein [Thermodesulfobacteriota bacterium]